MSIYEKYSDEWFLNLYLKYGSVDEVFKNYEEMLPISEASFHRKIATSSLINSAGKQASLAEVINFFEQKALYPGTPLEKLYRKMSSKFETSTVTMHRVYSALKNSLVRREGVALVLTPENNEEKILFAFEEKLNGELTIPMGFSKKGEEYSVSILRVLQQEVFKDLAIQRKLNIEIEKDIKPFSYIDITDVRVKVFRINIPDNLLNNFSSYKLKAHHFLNLEDLLKVNAYRSGVFEILRTYKKLLELEHKFEVRTITSELNKSLLYSKSI